MADRCNSSATSRVVQRRRWWRTASHHCRHLLSVSPSRRRLSVPSRALSSARSSGFLPLALSLLLALSLRLTFIPQSLHPPTVYRVRTDRTCLPSLSLPYPPPPSRPFALAPSDPSQPCLATVYYVRTNRATHVGPPRESPCNPLSRARARHPPATDGSRSGWRLHLARLSRGLSSRLETVRCVQVTPPVPRQPPNPGSFVAMTRRLATRRTRDVSDQQEVLLVVLAILSAPSHPLPRPFAPPARLAAAGSF